MFTIETYVTKFQGSDGEWKEDQAQQGHWAEQAGLDHNYGLEAAREFARVLTTQGSYAGRVRIVRRTDEILENL